MAELDGEAQGGDPAEVVSSAYPALFKVLAVFSSMGLATWGVRLALHANSHPEFISTPWMLAGTALMLFIAWHIVRSKTIFRAGSLEQTWVWQKKVEVQGLAYARLVHVPGLDWLVAPRLYTRTFDNRMQTFYGASAAMIEAFRSIQNATQSRAQSLKSPEK